MCEHLSLRARTASKTIVVIAKTTGLASAMLAALGITNTR